MLLLSLCFRFGLVAGCAGIAWAQNGQVPEAPPILPANIAPTPGTSPHGKVKVYGSPRDLKSHPCTLWDQEDIKALKDRLQTDEELRTRFEALKARMDKRISQPLGVPQPDGKPPGKTEYRAHSDNAKTICNLGIVYALTGDTKYGDFGKAMLIEYARVFPDLPHPEGWTEKRYRSAQDSRITGQFLEDGFWIATVAFGADLLHDVPGWTDDERKAVKEKLFEEYCSIFYHPIIKDGYYVNQTHNRAAVCASAVLMAGYATESQKLIDTGLYGTGGTKEKPIGGLFGVMFSKDCIFADGLWNEGAPAYQLGIASNALVNATETLWRHNIDMYSYGDGIFKRLLDSSIGLAYPDEKMTIPALHDSGVCALLDDRNWFSQELGVPYQAGYLRYRDPAYIPIIRNSYRDISMNVHAGPPSLFFDTPGEKELVPRRITSENYHSVGYGVLRLPAGASHNQLLMEYGPSGSHGHPSKLAIDFYALGQAVMPLPGVIFPYNHPLDPAWYWTTMANCALTVDQNKQITWGERYKYPRGTPNPEAKQILFAPGTAMGMQRACADNLYVEKIYQDRSLFLTPNYMADIYAVAAANTHLYDLAWHVRGKLADKPELVAYEFPQPVANGYNSLENVRHHATDSLWTIAIESPNKAPIRLLFAPGGSGAGTEIITGNGHFFTKRIEDDEKPPTIIQRRKDQKATIFGTVADVSGAAEPYIKSISQEGGFDAGYALLRVTTAQGIDFCYTSFKKDQMTKVDALETDAQQGLVVNNGASVEGLYLGGGKLLRYKAASISRSAPGLACLEKTPEGAFVISNPSPEAATISVTLPGLPHGAAYLLDVDGKRQDKIPLTTGTSPDSVSVELKAGARVELTASSS